ncbi:MAG TPA: YihY/virulence factor BrkB family protein [Chthoniobacteraceae bacterium]|jgi:Ca2+-transporting ATPase|nr:YihY/virulence factor BrkB family protein [Chthoniobacteraceae bacterium]
MTTDAPSRGFWHRLWRVLWLTVLRYSSIDGEQRAASFAYYAFFALFPLLLLLVSIGSYFYNPASAGDRVLRAVSTYVLVENDKHDMVTQTIRGVIKARRGVGSFAVLGLVWSSLRFFQALVRGVNRAWGTHEYTWWRLPIQNLLLVALTASALLIGMAAPTVLERIEAVVHLQFPFATSIISFVRFLLPSLVLFYGFSMFYKLAPRRKTTFREIWQAAALVTVLIQLLQGAFLLYTRNIAHFNAVYGAFGSVIAVLMWIYLSGSVIILGGCFSASQAEIAGKLDYAAAAEMQKRGG